MSKKKGQPVSIWLDEDIEKWLAEEADKREWTRSKFAAKMLREAMSREKKE